MKETMTTAAVWIFSAPRAAFPAGVFSSAQQARAWVARHRLTGVLTAYPVGEGVYDWAVGQGLFPADKPAGSAFVGSFSSAHQEHYHFTDGVEEGSGAS